MKCPNDQTVLALSYRSGVEIDYCPECRGVWLDRGELDKLLVAAEGESKPNYTQSDRHHSSHHDHDEDSPRGQMPQKQKREGFLGELFDF